MFLKMLLWALMCFGLFKKNKHSEKKHAGLTVILNMHFFLSCILMSAMKTKCFPYELHVTQIDYFPCPQLV